MTLMQVEIAIYEIFDMFRFQFFSPPRYKMLEGNLNSSKLPYSNIYRSNTLPWKECYLKL